MSEKLAPDLLYETLSDGEAALLDVHRRHFFTLNESAKYIFERLQQGASFDSISTDMAAEFEVDEAECRHDIDAFLSELRSRGMLIGD